MMRRLTFLLCATSLGLLLAFTTTPANAGHWEVVYDLEGSTLLTTDPVGGQDIDPIIGTMTAHYDTPGTATAPITGARLVAGHTFGDMYQPSALLTMTGTTDTVLIPQTGGAPGTMTGATINWAIVADSSRTGFLHCTSPGTACTAFGMPQSFNVPQTPTVNNPPPHPFPNQALSGRLNWIFTSGTIGTGNWTAPPVPDQVTLKGFLIGLETTYQGREISRTFVPEPNAILLLASGAGLLVLLGRLRRR
jgi:hypothetical protein